MYNMNSANDSIEQHEQIDRRRLVLLMMAQYLFVALSFSSQPATLDGGGDGSFFWFVFW